MEGWPDAAPRDQLLGGGPEVNPGPLLASGRDADIFEYGPGRVLRRSRDGRSMVNEARAMAHVGEEGYPVPRVEEVSDDGTDLVMERIEGPSMVELLNRRPWTAGRLGGVLADLHQRLHRLAAPDWLRAAPVGAGDRMVHLDLHPLNVLMSARGPVVIDWSNAARGEPAVDVALTWALMHSGEVDAGALVALVAGKVRRRLVGAFLAGVDRPAAAEAMSETVAWKCTDAHMSVGEQAGMRGLAAAQTPGAPG
jgi:aminoglycoside phosphotransferase (APT) family kinase protein